jgi:hypothetical protein
MPTNPLDPANLRKRFADLGEQREAILAKTTPLREKRDALVQEVAAKIRPLDDEIQKFEGGGILVQIDQERATIVRALGGKTSEPEAEPADDAAE